MERRCSHCGKFSKSSKTLHRELYAKFHKTFPGYEAEEPRKTVFLCNDCWPKSIEWHRSLH